MLPVVLHLAASEERPIAYQRSKSGISSEGATADSVIRNHDDKT